MNAKPIIFSPSRADQKWLHFVNDVKALAAGTYDRNYKTPDADPEVPQAYLDQHLKPKQEQLVQRYEQVGYSIPGKTSAEKFQHLIDLKPFRKNNGDEIRMLKADVEEYAEHVSMTRGNYRYMKLLDEESETTPVPMDADLDEFLEQHGCKSFASANTEQDALQSLLYTDLAYGSLEGDFAGIQDNDGLRILEALGFASAEDFGDREKWLRLYNSMTREQWETATQTIANEYSIETPDAKNFIEDVLVAIKPMIKELKNNADATFLMEINGDLELPVALRKTLEQRAKEHFSHYQSILKTK